MKLQKFLVVILCFFCIACGKEQKLEDGDQFKAEYEAYNNEYVSLDISSDNLIKYCSLDEVNTLIRDGTGVIYLGSPKDNLSRVAVDILLEASDNTDLNVIYYLDSLDGVVGLDDIVDLRVPLVLFVLEGEIVDYHVGTVQDKVELSNDEVVELYNIYLDGIHQVLQDSCDERC